jgi:DNA-binding transcriptional regulator YdaS (Cro superfamily)
MASQIPSQGVLIAQAILGVPGGRQEDLAAAMGVAQQTVSKLLRGEVPVSPEQAIAIHRATRGAVPGSALRPDLWCRPDHVPVQESVQEPADAPSEDEAADPSARAAS